MAISWEIHRKTLENDGFSGKPIGKLWDNHGKTWLEKDGFSWDLEWDLHCWMHCFPTNMDYSLENHRKMENPGKTWLENDGFSWDLEWDLPSLVSSNMAGWKIAELKRGF